ncbi:hypothetical protein [Rugamonas sp.]|uniref:hypothetical protein n=1 Tax=Rugamonas sp. TaxID=1926287 RepID=UPI0025FF66A5|nr:hypothetical protein [Rugamonas sp.]
MTNNLPIRNLPIFQLLILKDIERDGGPPHVLNSHGSSRTLGMRRKGGIVT